MSKPSAEEDGRACALEGTMLALPEQTNRYPQLQPILALNHVH